MKNGTIAARMACLLVSPSQAAVARGPVNCRTAFDREVDQILERVHQVGMSGLTEREKAVLKRASQRRRGAG